MTIYPDQIDNAASLPPAVDNSTPVEASVVNNLRDAIVAIERALGTKPGALYGSVASRFSVLENIVGNLQIIELDGDLGNTLETPYVIGIWGRPISPAQPNVNDSLVWDGIAWIPSPVQGGGGGGGAPTGPAGGDLSGIYPNPNVAKLQNNPVKSGILGIGQDGYLLTWVNSAGNWQAKSPPVSFSAGGDLSGTNTSQTVIGINGATVPISGALVTGNILQVNGASSLSYGPVNLAGGSNYVIGTLPIGNLPNLLGDVTGSITSNTVIKLQNNAVQSGALGAIQDGYVLTWVNGSTNWQAKPSNSGISPINATGFVPFTTGNTTFTNAAGFLFDPTTFPNIGNRRIKLRIVAETTGPSFTAQLYNFTAASVVSGTTLTTSSTSAIELVTGDLTGLINNGKAFYQVQIKMASGLVSDQITLDFARLEVTYT